MIEKHAELIRKKINNLDSNVKGQAFRIIGSFREHYASTGRDAFPGWTQEQLTPGLTYDAAIRQALHHLILRRSIWDGDDQKHLVYPLVKTDIDARVESYIIAEAESATVFKSRMKGLEAC